jgi:cbb3-type cytochrome oxidase maturation protein
MSAVYIALPIALLLAIAGVVAFIWATKSGQMDDLETPGHRVLFDDEETPKTGNGPDRAGDQSQDG